MAGTAHSGQLQPIKGELLNLGYNSGKWVREHFTMSVGLLNSKSGAIFLDRVTEVFDIPAGDLSPELQAVSLAQGSKLRAPVRPFSFVVTSRTPNGKRGHVLCAPSSSLQKFWMKRIKQFADPSKFDDDGEYDYVDEEKKLSLPEALKKTPRQFAKHETSGESGGDIGTASVAQEPARTRARAHSEYRGYVNRPSTGNAHMNVAGGGAGYTQKSATLKPKISRSLPGVDGCSVGGRGGGGRGGGGRGGGGAGGRRRSEGRGTGQSGVQPEEPTPLRPEKSHTLTITATEQPPPPPRPNKPKPVPGDVSVLNRSATLAKRDGRMSVSQHRQLAEKQVELPQFPGHIEIPAALPKKAKDKMLASLDEVEIHCVVALESNVFCPDNLCGWVVTRYSNGVVHSSTTPELRPYDLIFCVGDKEYIDGACTLDVAAVIADASPDKRFLKVYDLAKKSFRKVALPPSGTRFGVVTRPLRIEGWMADSYSHI